MRFVLLAILLLAAACKSDITGPFRDAKRIEPESYFFTWWHEVQQEAGKFFGDLRIKWYVVAMPWYDEAYGHAVHGGWAPSGKIYLDRDYVFDKGLVKHESLHEWIYHNGDRTGDPEHEYPLFRVYTPML